MITDDMTKQEFIEHCQETYERDGNRIGDVVLGALWEYWHNHEIGGHFLKSLLTNDLCMAVQRADLVNIRALPQLVDVIWNCIPTPIWGDLDKYKKHIGGRVDARR